MGPWSLESAASESHRLAPAAAGSRAGENHSRCGLGGLSWQAANAGAESMARTCPIHRPTERTSKEVTVKARLLWRRKRRAARVRRLPSRVDAAEAGSTKTAMAEHPRRERRRRTRGGARTAADEPSRGPVGEVAHSPSRRRRSVDVVARVARRGGSQWLRSGWVAGGGALEK
jgi:hypothetical protein